MAEHARPRPSGPMLVLGPHRRHAAAWTAAGLIGVGAAAWVVRDTSGAVLAWVLLASMGTLTVALAAPALAPELTTVTLDQTGLTGRLYGRRVRVDWDAVVRARLTTVAGEPVLELHERDPAARPSPSGRVRTEPRGLLLPLGCDLEALDAFLGERLGRGPLPGA